MPEGFIVKYPWGSQSGWNGNTPNTPAWSRETARLFIASEALKFGVDIEGFTLIPIDAAYIDTVEDYYRNLEANRILAERSV